MYRGCCGILGAATTADVYMQEIPGGVEATAESISQELRREVREKRSKKEGSKKFAAKCYQTKNSVGGNLLI